MFACSAEQHWKLLSHMSPQNGDGDGGDLDGQILNEKTAVKLNGLFVLGRLNNNWKGVFEFEPNKTTATAATTTMAMTTAKTTITVTMGKRWRRR